MDKSISGFKLKLCPFCGNAVKLNFEPLYHDGHGYEGCFNVSVGCKKCRYSLPAFNTIYEPIDEAISQAVGLWNQRAGDE